MLTDDYKKLLIAAKNWAVSAEDEDLDAAIIALETKLTLWRDSSKAVNEFHRVTVDVSPDLTGVCLLPILERVHSIAPETPIKYLFSSDEEGLVLNLVTAGRKPILQDEATNSQMLHRSIPFLRKFVNANRAQDGECLQCGAHSRAACETDCPTLECEMLLGSLTKRGIEK